MNTQRYEDAKCCVFPPSLHQGDSKTRMIPKGMNLQRKEELDSILAQSMTQLSFQERQAIQEELHGITEDITEELGNNEMCLLQLENFLARTKHRTAFEEAEAADSDYVANRDFRLMFLRGNRYDPKAASQQMLRFFDMKLELFGKEKLVQDITLKDLNEDARAALQNGSMQVLPFTDRAKRQILLQILGLRKYKSLTDELRGRFYLYMTMLQSNETQRRGIVSVTYCVDQFRDCSNGGGFLEHTKLALTIPLQFAGLHFCSDDVGQYVLTSAAIAIMPGRLRAKFKVHFGSHLECQYYLSTFGIPREALCTSIMNEKAMFDRCMFWYRDRYQMEVGGHLPQNLLDMGEDPHLHDVLFGKHSRTHPGNKRFHSLIERASENYDTASKKRRFEITNHIMQCIHETGGRMLKQTGGSSSCWQLLAEEEARDKIAQKFRSIRRPRTANVILASSSNEGTRFFDCHGPNDVLFGRQRSNGGNKLIRKLVRDLADDYDGSTKAGKIRLADSVMREIHQKGGRFLERTADGKWEEVTNDTARNKVSKHFSNCRRSESRISI